MTAFVFPRIDGYHVSMCPVLCQPQLPIELNNHSVHLSAGREKGSIIHKLCQDHLLDSGKIIHICDKQTPAGFLWPLVSY